MGKVELMMVLIGIIHKDFIKQEVIRYVTTI